MDSAKSSGESVELFVERLAGDLSRRGGAAFPEGTEAEMRQSLRKGVSHLRQHAIPDQEIRDHLLRVFYTVRERLLSPSETRPSLFWTVFEYIGGVPLVLVVLVWLLPCILDLGALTSGSESSLRILGALLQVALTFLIALDFFLMQLDVCEGAFLKRRRLFPRQRWPLGEIERVEFEKIHLFGQRRIVLRKGRESHKLESNIRGFPSTAFLLSFLPESVFSVGVRRSLREAWLTLPLETPRFTSVAASALILANLVWYWKWEDIWQGNGITWYSLGALLVAFVVTTQMGMRITGSARIGVLRFLLSGWFFSILLIQGFLFGPISFVRMALFPLSLCVSMPLLVLFCSQRTFLVLAFAALSAVAGYMTAQTYQPADKGLLFATKATFPTELKQKSGGFVWTGVAHGSEECIIGQMTSGRVIETRLGKGAWCLLPSKPDEVYVGLVQMADSSSSACLGKLGEDGRLEMLSCVPNRSTPLMMNSELVWSPGSSHLIVPLRAPVRKFSVKAVALNLRNGEQNDFQGLGSCNVVQWLDDHRFEAVWIPPVGSGESSATQELELVRYDVRTSEALVVKSTTLHEEESVSFRHLPKSSCVLLCKETGPETEWLAIVDLSDGVRHDLGNAERRERVRSWNGSKRLFAYVVAGTEGTSLKVFDVERRKTLEKVYPARTRFGQLSFSSDGTKLFYLSYRLGFPYIFARMVKGDVWNLSSGKIQSVYCPGCVQGFFMTLATHRLPEHRVIQWAADGEAVIASELSISLPGGQIPQRFYRYSVGGQAE